MVSELEASKLKVDEDVCDNEDQVEDRFGFQIDKFGAGFDTVLTGAMPRR